MLMWWTLSGFVVKRWQVVAALLLAFQVAVEGFVMGRPWVCTCGVKLWTSDGVTGESSQQVADWYTLSHFIHGMLFYMLAWLVGRKWPAGVRLLMAMLIEITWEFFENSPYVIAHYRNGTAAVDYKGDTILNSGFDTVWMMMGFAIACKLPVRWTIALAIGFELLAGAVIRDNLTLNVLTFLWPIKAVVDWQSGA